MSNGDYSFNIMHEAVAAEDAFPDQTHKKTADTLFDLMESSDRGVTIGLEGGWGSGKSTVVNLLKKRLDEKDGSTLFFLFDAWAHDGDPLRRIFLESLIDEIDTEENDGELIKLKNKISGRKKTIDVRTWKTTSRLGGFISLSAILVPVGAAMLSALDYDSIYMPWNTSGYTIYFPFVIGFLLTVAPFWVLLWWRWAGDKDEKRKKTWLAGDKQWDIFAADSTEKYTQDITEDGERTSIEFEMYFKRIMNYAIGEGNKFGRAVIVVDNLDRVEPDKTLAIWSILQTFFQHRSKLDCMGKDIWLYKLWFLIPYDRQGLSNVWNGIDGNIELTPNADKLTVWNNSNNNKTEVAPSFLEKCFQIIAEVPEPVMTAWVEYSEKRIKESLVGWPEEEVNEIIEVFRRFESRLDSSPTPRQILSFINRVGLLGLRFGGEMSAEAIALYALTRRNRSEREMRTVLLCAGLPDGFATKNDNKNVKHELAGMLFGVNKEKGIQLLLEPEIKSALNDGDSKKISNLIESHGEAFWVVWEAIMELSLPNGHVEEYRITVTKAFCQGVSAYKSKAELSIRRLVEEWKNTEDRWELNNYDYSEALDALLQVMEENSELVSWLDGIVKKRLKGIINAVDKDDFDAVALRNISNLIQLLTNYGIDVPVTQYSKLDQNRWKIWKKALTEEAIEISNVLPVKGAIEAISNSLDINNPNTEDLGTLISTIKDTKNSGEWEIVADKMVAWAGNANRQLGNNTAYQLIVNIYLKCNEAACKTIKGVIANSNFIQKTQQEDIDVTHDLLTLCAVVQKGKLLSSGFGTKVDSFWQADYDKQNCKHVTASLEELGALEIVWLLATDPNNKVAIGIILSGDFDGQVFSSAYGPRYVGKLDWASDQELEQIISKAINYGGLAKAKQTLVDKPADYRDCLKLIGLYGGEKGMDITREALENTKSSDWEETLAQDSVLFDCIEEKGNHEFKAGFMSLVEKEFSEENFTDYIWNDFGRFYNKIMDQKDVAKIIAELYFHSEKELLSDQAYEQVWPIIKSFVKSINPDQIMARVEYWLANSQWKRISSLLEAGIILENDPKESLISRVRALLKESDEDQKEILLSLAKVFRIDVDIPEGDESDSKNE